MNNLGVSYGDLGRWEESETYLEIVHSNKHVLGSEHPESLKVMSNLGLACGVRGNWARATELQESSLATCEKVTGKQNPLTLAVMHALAQTYYSTNREKEAELLEREVIKGRTKVLGEQHPDTRSATETLGSVRANREKRTTRCKQYPDAAGVQPERVQRELKIVAPQLQHTVGNMLAQCKVQLGDRFLVCTIGQRVVCSSPGNSDWRMLSHTSSSPTVPRT